MKRYAGISIRGSKKIFYFEAGALSLEIGDDVVIETERGVNIGKVKVLPTNELPKKLLANKKSMKKVIHKAREDDYSRLAENKIKEEESFKVCSHLINELHMAMKLIRAEYLHDSSKVIFYFMAENRVDFRELVRNLARQLHVRIEMRQIGIRDAAGMVGGVGVCGRELCCSSFLCDFDPVTVKMAKEQGLALNPVKISGLCGRLMCCLDYEYKNYLQRRRERQSHVKENNGSPKKES